MHLDEGLDTLAGFADGSARYLNHSGAAIVWEVPDATVGRLVAGLLDAARAVVAMTRPLSRGRQPAPPPGEAMISVLTPGGIHALGGTAGGRGRTPTRRRPVIAAASRLLAQLVERASPPGDARPARRDGPRR